MRLWAPCPQPFPGGGGAGVSPCGWACCGAHCGVLTHRAPSAPRLLRLHVRLPGGGGGPALGRPAALARPPRGDLHAGSQPRCPGARLAAPCAGPELWCPCNPSGPVDCTLCADGAPPPPGPGFSLRPKQCCLPLPDPSLGRAPGLLPAVPLSPRHRSPGTGFLTGRQAPHHPGSVGGAGGRWSLSPCQSWDPWAADTGPLRLPRGLWRRHPGLVEHGHL